MSHRLFTALGAALVLAAAGPGTAFAQSTSSQTTTSQGSAAQDNTTSQSQRRGPSRNLSSQRFRAPDQSNRNRQNQPQANPEETKATAQALLAGDGKTCEIGEAVALGQTDEGKQVYEVTCATGGGYMLFATEPALVTSCVELSSSAQIERERDPNAVAGQQCTLAANQDLLPAYAGLARTAGVSCTVDQGILAGRNTENGAITYEIGCADQSGYWIRQNADGAWVKFGCYDLVLQPNGRCRFTSEGEIAGSWAAAAAGTDVASCEPASQRRRVGVDAQGRTVFELKCASGEGYLVRMDGATDKITQTHPCAQAAHIAGGCTLTAAAPAAAPAPGGRP